MKAEEGKNPFSLWTSLPALSVPCPFHLREPPSTRRPFHKLILPLSFLLLICVLSSPVFSLNIYTYIHAHILTSFYLGPWNGDKSGFSLRDTTLSLCRRRFSGRNWNVGINVSQLEIQHVEKITDEECHSAFRTATNTNFDV